MKLLTDREVTQHIKDLYRKLKCVILPYPTFNDFPRPGKGNTLYIDMSTDPNELWRWDCDLKDYVQVGGGGGGSTDAIHFSQLSFNVFEGPVVQNVTEPFDNFIFSSVANIGTDVVGSLVNNSIVVGEAAWYQIDFSSLTITNQVGDIIVHIYRNLDLLAEIILYSDSIVSGHVNHSWSKKINLDPGDEIYVQVGRPLVQGASSIDRLYAEFSVQKITLGYIEAVTGLNIPQSGNYGLLPPPGTEVGLYRWVINTVGLNNAGLYYSDGLTWETAPGSVQVNSDWNSVAGPSEILNKPVIPAAQVSSDWNSVISPTEILNKPVIPAAQVSSDWNSVVSPTEILNKPSIPVKTIVPGVVLIAANFVLNAGYYEYDYANGSIGVTSMVTVTPLNSTISIVSAAVFLPEITTSAGSAKLFCTNLPSGNIDVDVWILT